MKNLKNNTLVIFAIAAFLFLAYAIELVPSSAEKLEKDMRKSAGQSCIRPEMYLIENGHFNGKIEIVDIPLAIKSAVLVKYVAYSIDEVFRDRADSYKLILKSGKNKLAVYYSGDGEFLRQEKIKTVEMIALI